MLSNIKETFLETLDVLSQIQADKVTTETSDKAVETFVESMDISGVTVESDISRELMTYSAKAAMGGVTGGLYAALQSTVQGQTFNSDFDAPEVTTENFDGGRADWLQAATYTYNVNAAKQDDFSEALFPTVISDPKYAGIKVIIRSPYVQEPALRSNALPDKPKFNKQSIIANLTRGNSVFGKDYVKLIPIAGTIFDEVLEVREFPNKVFYDASNEEVDTAPYKLGKTIPIMGVSQTANLISQGVMEQSDTLESAVRYEKLYFKVDTDKIALDISHLPGATFIAGGRDDSGDIVSNINTTMTVQLDALTQYNGDATTAFGDVPPGFKAVFNVRITGQANVADGDIVVDVNAFSFAAVRDAAGKIVQSGEDGYNETKDAAEKFEAKAYDIDAKITNTNTRRNGISLTAKETTETLPIRAKTPLHTEKPIRGQDVGDSEAYKIETLVITSGILASVNAVRVVSGFINHMTNVTNTTVSGDELNIETVTSKLINPYFRSEVLDIPMVMDSLSSGQRSVDLRATVLDHIKNSVADMLTKSGLNAFTRYVSKKPVRIVIATYPKLAQWLSDSNGILSLGDNVTAKIVSTDIEDAMDGKIFITIGDEAPSTTEVNPMRFGTFNYTPSLVSEGVITENGATKTKLIVNPRFEHNITMPIATFFTVVGLEAALDKNIRFTKVIEE